MADFAFKDFEWDEAKDIQNQKKHGFGFREAALIFYGPVVSAKSKHRGEERWTAIGLLEENLEITVVYTVRNDRIRVISARRARRYERTLLQTHLARLDDVGGD